MNLCVVCESEAKLVLCPKCQRSYDRMTKRMHDIASIIEWAAKQTRKAERKKAPPPVPPSPAYEPPFGPSDGEAREAARVRAETLELQFDRPGHAPGEE